MCACWSKISPSNRRKDFNISSPDDARRTLRRCSVNTLRGQAIRVEGMNFYRLENGRVTDIWTQFDGAALMQQLSQNPA
jgi:hypothetical protein